MGQHLHPAPCTPNLADYWNASLPGAPCLRREPTQQQFKPLVTAPMVSVTSRVVYILRSLISGAAARMDQLFSPRQSRSTNVLPFWPCWSCVRGGRVTLGENGELTMQRTRIKEKK